MSTLINRFDTISSLRNQQLAEMLNKVHWSSLPLSCWGHRGHWGGRGSKAWKIPTEDFRVFIVLEFNKLRTNITLYWCLKIKFFWQNHENSRWILELFLSEAVEASLCYFFKNWLMKLKCPNLSNMQIPSL